MKILLTHSIEGALSADTVLELEELWRAQTPDCVLFSGGYRAVELMARLSIRVKAPCCTGAVSVTAADGGYIVKRHVYGGELTAEYHLPAPCLIALDRECDPEELSLPDKPVTIELTYLPDRWFMGFFSGADRTANELKSAKKIIAVGRGIKRWTQVQTVMKLADRLDASVGATRPVVHKGWAPLNIQIGISGAPVKPDVCLIIGASGSQAFLSAIDKKTKIIAVDADPDSQVFRRADLGVVGDGIEIIRELMELTGSEQ